jgi:hypothetical protein
MGDMLLSSAEQSFWPPSERTEAQSASVANQPDSWLYGFLGSTVRSFAAAHDRVVVLRCTANADAWALGPRVSVGHPVWTGMPSEWSPEPTWLFIRSMWDVGLDVLDEVPHTSAVSIHDRMDTEVAAELAMPRPTLESALTNIHDWFGFSDGQIEAATGVSRTTLWRLRTGKINDSRSNTDSSIWRLQALASSLIAVLGQQRTMSWLHSGSPSPADLLLSGRFDDAERASDRVLFPGPLSRSFSAVSDDDYGSGEVASPTAPLPLRARRVRKATKR